jgi:ketosteroid isomerase-like protein
MKRLCLAVATFLCIGVGIGFATQEQAAAKPLTPLEQSLIANEKDFIAAIKKGDAAYFKRTLTDDFSIVFFDGQLYDRQDALDQLSGGGVDLMPYNIKVVTAGDSAIVTYDSVMTVPPEEDQGPPPRYQHWTSVWVKQGDAWKLKFQQTTPTHWGDW